MRKLLMALSLSCVCIAGAFYTGVVQTPRLHAQEIPACANSQCSGPSYCVYGNNHSCQFDGPNACTTKRCAFVMEH